MVVKLPSYRVAELVDSGRGAPVAPSGRTFKEWVEISADEEWTPYLEEALAFATD